MKQSWRRSQTKGGCATAEQHVFLLYWLAHSLVVLAAFAVQYSMHAPLPPHLPHTSPRFAQPLYTSGLIASINVLWSSYVVVAYAVLEQDVSPSIVLHNPALYRETMRYGRRPFLVDQALYLLQGVWHGMAIYFVPM